MLSGATGPALPANGCRGRADSGSLPVGASGRQAACPDRRAVESWPSPRLSAPPELELDGAEIVSDERCSAGRSAEGRLSWQRVCPCCAHSAPSSLARERAHKKRKPSVWRRFSLVGGTGLEPVTPSLSSWCSPTELTALGCRILAKGRPCRYGSGSTGRPSRAPRGGARPCDPVHAPAMSSPRVTCSPRRTPIVARCAYTVTSPGRADLDHVPVAE